MIQNDFMTGTPGRRHGSHETVKTVYIEVSNGFLLGDLRPRGMLDGML